MAQEKAPVNKRPEPQAFMFRPQQPGEYPEEYATLKARAKRKWERGGRAEAIKGMMGDNVSTRDAGDEPTTNR